MSRAFGCALFLSLTLTNSAAAKGKLILVIDDSSTHYGVPALVKATGPELFEIYLDETGVLHRMLDPREYTFDASARGYHDRKHIKFTLREGDTTAFSFSLTPLEPPEEEKLLLSRIRPGFTLISGYILDRRNRPISGVKVYMERAGTSIVTDERGYYWLSVPTPPETAIDVPGTDTLIAEKPGFTTVVYHNIMLAGGDGGGWYIGLYLGSGRVESDKTHKMFRTDQPPEGEVPRALMKRFTGTRLTPSSSLPADRGPSPARSAS